MSLSLRPLLCVPVAACALLGGCGLAPLAGPRPEPLPPASAGARAQRAKAEPGWIAQAWAGWQRAQSSPAYKPNPVPRLALSAPTPLEPALLSRIQLAPSVGPALSGEGDFGLGGILATSIPPPLQPSFVTAVTSAGGALAGTSALWQQALRDAEAASAAVQARGSQEPGIAAGSWKGLQNAAEARQELALRELALRVATQRRASGADAEGLLRADLSNDIERVGRADLDSLVPALPPRSELDRLTDLRLKLLRALAIAPAQQRQAQADLERTELQIRALLREQEIERATLLGKLRREVPARLEAQRNAEIQRALEQARSADASAIAALLQGQGQRIRRDFGAPARFSIPSAARGQVAAAGTAGSVAGSTSGSVRSSENRLRTFASPGPSGAPIAAPSLRAVQVLEPGAQAPGVVPEPGAQAPGVVPEPGAQAPGVVPEPGAGARRQAGAGQGQRWRALLLKRARAWQAKAR